MTIEQTLDLILNHSIIPSFLKEPTSENFSEKDFNIFNYEEYQKLSEQEQEDFMKNVGLILGAAKTMGMIFKDEFYQKIENYIFEEE